MLSSVNISKSSELAFQCLWMEYRCVESEVCTKGFMGFFSLLDKYYGIPITVG